MTRVPVTMERIRTSQAAAILGVETRTVQALALRGELPDAARIGGIWTFSEAALRNYIKERTSWPKDRRPLSTRTGGKASYGRGSLSTDMNIEEAYAQMSRKLRGHA